jgi:hypothetical protein
MGMAVRAVICLLVLFSRKVSDQRTVAILNVAVQFFDVARETRLTLTTGPRASVSSSPLRAMLLNPFSRSLVMLTESACRLSLVR